MTINRENVPLTALYLQKKSYAKKTRLEKLSYLFLVKEDVVVSVILSCARGPAAPQPVGNAGVGESDDCQGDKVLHCHQTGAIKRENET